MHGRPAGFTASRTQSGYPVCAGRISSSRDDRSDGDEVVCSNNVDQFRGRICGDFASRQLVFNRLLDRAGAMAAGHIFDAKADRALRNVCHPRDDTRMLLARAHGCYLQKSMIAATCTFQLQEGQAPLSQSQPVGSDKVIMAVDRARSGRLSNNEWPDWAGVWHTSVADFKNSSAVFRSTICPASMTMTRSATRQGSRFHARCRASVFPCCSSKLAPPYACRP